MEGVCLFYFPFGLFYDCMVIWYGYFMVIWYILRPFGIFSLFWYVVPRKIWQPWSEELVRSSDRILINRTCPQSTYADQMPRPAARDRPQLKNRSLSQKSHTCKRILSTSFGIHFRLKISWICLHPG
jgi:hypothetical protein